MHILIVLKIDSNDRHNIVWYSTRFFDNLNAWMLRNWRICNSGSNKKNDFQKWSGGTTFRILRYRDGTVIVLRCIPSSISFFSFLLLSDLRSRQSCHKQNGTAKRCPGQGLQIQEQVRMLRFGHACSRCHRRRTQAPGSRPRYCARKVGLCKSHDSEF